MLQRLSNAIQDRASTGHQADAPEGNAQCDDLLRHLERVDMVLQRAVMHARRNSDDKHDLEGLMHPQERVDSGLLTGRPRWATGSDAPHAFTVMGAGEPTMQLQQVVARFALSPFERDVLLLGLLPWFDARYALLFAYLQDDSERQLPTVDLALRLLGPKGWDRTRQAAMLAPDAPLLRHRLVRLQHRGEAARHWGDLLISVDRHLYHHLAGHAAARLPGLHFASLPDLMLPCARWLRTPSVPDCCPELTARLQQRCFGERGAGGHGRTTGILLLRGSMGSGRAMALSHAAATAGWPLLSVDLGLLPEQDDTAREVLSLTLREARLHAAGLVLRGLHALQEERHWLFAQLSVRLVDHVGPVACLLEPHCPLVWVEGLPQWLVDMPERSHASDEALLQHQIAQVLPGTRLAQDVDLAALVKRVTPSVDTLQDTLREADGYRRQRGADALLTQSDLVTAFRLRSQQNFGKLAQRITPVRTFDDLVVGDELQQQLREILAAIRQRDRALQQGFGRKVRYGTGISALFHGDSGTGKTMVAEVLAGALGVDLIKIDLSTVVNKYIGETEKNLARIFDLAAADAGVLFFDEADALFGKRSETKDAQDRHANIEVSYLLQRLEAHPGLVVLATNNRSHLDDAFTRRLTFMTRFPFPDEALRERMWKGAWPPGVLVDESISFSELARKAAITGASIRNAALLATWLASDEEAPSVRPEHVVRALHRELAKSGRLASIN